MLLIPDFREKIEIKCPDCNEFFDGKLWEESEVPCDDCGTHRALRCPKCGEDLDTITHDFVIKRNHGNKKKS